MRYPAPNVQRQLQGLLESRSPLAATVVSTAGAHYVVLTLVPLKAVRLFRRGTRALWETRVYISKPPPDVGLAARPEYAVFDENREEALARHERLVARLEGECFEVETGREIARMIGLGVNNAAKAFRAGDFSGAVATLDEVIGIAGRLDATLHFLSLYQEAFLMRGVALECLDGLKGKQAYRDFIALCASLAPCRPDTLRAVAWAREAVERLTPIPDKESAPRRPGSSEKHDTWRANGPTVAGSHHD